MAQIPTAEEWLLNHKELSKYDVAEHDEGGYLGVNEDNLYKIMVEFAKLHVEAALKEASEKATWQNESFDTYFGDLRNFDFIDTDGAGDPSTGHNVFVDIESILNSYPLDKIK
jgi:hypothetical protein